MPRLTLWGMNEYMPLFDDIRVPEGMDRQELVSVIMEKSGDLYPYYQVPARLKSDIKGWFNRKYDAFSRMYVALHAEYNPIENYDRYEDEEETPNITHTATASGTTSAENSGSGSGETSDSRSNGSSTTTTNKRSAFDSNTFENDSEVTSGVTASDGGTSSYSNETSGSAKNEYNNTSKDVESGDRKRKAHIHGNIGVTTAQQMITAELELRKFDLYEHIAALFEADMLIQVY